MLPLPGDVSHRAGACRRAPRHRALPGPQAPPTAGGRSALSTGAASLSLAATARRRSRIEDPALLVVRASSVLALAVLGATPFVRCVRLSLARPGGASVALAIVIDDSMSMRARRPADDALRAGARGRPGTAGLCARGGRVCGSPCGDTRSRCARGHHGSGGRTQGAVAGRSERPCDRPRRSPFDSVRPRFGIAPGREARRRAQQSGGRSRGCPPSRGSQLSAGLGAASGASRARHRLRSARGGQDWLSRSRGSGLWPWRNRARAGGPRRGCGRKGPRTRDRHVGWSPHDRDGDDCR